MIWKCSRCHRPSVAKGLCAHHLRAPLYRPPAPHTPPRVRTQRVTDPHPILSTEAWRSLRKDFLHQHPWCARCQRRPKQKGGPMRTMAVHVDHIFPLRRYEEKAFDWGNLQALCRPCHTIKTGHESGGRYYDYARNLCYAQDVAGDEP